MSLLVFSLLFFGPENNSSDCPFLFTTEFPHTYIHLRHHVRRRGGAKFMPNDVSGGKGSFNISNLEVVKGVSKFKWLRFCFFYLLNNVYASVRLCISINPSIRGCK